MGLWYPGAVRRPGPTGRVSGPPQPKHGAVYHSMVGLGRPEDTANSWQFGVFKDGHVEQYYVVTAWCWQSGDRDDPGSDITNNRDLFGIEHEGGPAGNESEPLTAKQLAATIELTKWAVAEGHIHKLTRTGPHRGLWEHNEMRATACPSGRIPWRIIIQRAQKEEEAMAFAFKVTGRGNTVFVDTGTDIRRVASGAALGRMKKHGVVPDKPAPTISQAEYGNLLKARGQA